MAAERIRTRLKRTAEDIVAIGQDLIVAKKIVGHGQFEIWVHTEFGMSPETAQNFMHVAERFGRESGIIPELPATILYLLAAPSTPEAVVEQVTSGDVAPKVKDVQGAIKAAKEEAKKAKQEAEQVKQELWVTQNTARDLESQRKRAEGEAAQVRAHMDLLREELEELRAAQHETITEVREVVPDSVKQRIADLERQIAEQAQAVAGDAVMDMDSINHAAEEASRLLAYWGAMFRSYRGKAGFKTWEPVFRLIDQLA